MWGAKQASQVAQERWRDLVVSEQFWMLTVAVVTWIYMCDKMAQRYTDLMPMTISWFWYCISYTRCNQCKEMGELLTLQLSVTLQLVQRKKLNQPKTKKSLLSLREKPGVFHILVTVGFGSPELQLYKSCKPHRKLTGV